MKRRRAAAFAYAAASRRSASDAIADCWKERQVCSTPSTEARARARASDSDSFPCGECKRAESDASAGAIDATNDSVTPPVNDIQNEQLDEMRDVLAATKS